MSKPGPGKSKPGTKPLAKKAAPSKGKKSKGGKEPAPKSNKTLIIVISSVVAVLVIGIGVWVAISMSSSKDDKVAQNTPPADKRKEDPPAQPPAVNPPPANENKPEMPPNPQPNPPMPMPEPTSPPPNPDMPKPEMPKPGENPTPSPSPSPMPTPGDTTPPANTVALALSETLNTEKPELPELKKQVTASLFTVKAKLERAERYSTGFIVSEKGFGVCSFDAVRQAREISITTADGILIPVKEYVISDAGKNLFLFKINAEGQKFKPLPLMALPVSNDTSVYLAAADSQKSFDVRPATLISELKAEEVSKLTGYSRPGTYLQASIKTLPMNHGGPLIDASGNVTGMLSYQLAYSNQATFFTNIIDIRDFLAQAEGKTLLPVDQENVSKWEPDFSKYETDNQRKGSYHEFERRMAYDLTNTSYADAAYAKMETIKLSMEDFTGKNDSSRSATMVSSIATQNLKNSELKFVEGAIEAQDNAIIIYIYPKETKNSDPNVKELRVMAQVIVPASDLNPYKGYLKIWQSEEVNLGDINLANNNDGGLPKSALEKIKNLILGVKSQHTRAKRLAQNNANKSGDLEQEILKNFSQPQKPVYLDEFVKRRVKGTI